MPGSVSYAGWSLSYAIPYAAGKGLVLSNIKFNGKSVLYRIEQPFSLVPYHTDNPTYKEGLSAMCDGVAYKTIKPHSPNTTWTKLPLDSYTSSDTEYDPVSNPKGAVMVDRMPATFISPEKLMIWAKFQVDNYQYIHMYEFAADGMIHVKAGLGGQLLRSDEAIGGHIHNFYYRLDFDVAGDNNRVQRFAHTGNGAGDDHWTDIMVESVETVDPKTFTRWRVINTTPKANGRYPSYEIIPGSDGAPDGTYSSGDLWVVRYSPTGGETGSDVRCNDQVLSTKYVNGQSVDGEDLVVWYCLRHHHFPWASGEEKTMLPYHFVGFMMKPRDFLDDTPKNLYPTKPSSP